jgi:hypothetical protein
MTIVNHVALVTLNIIREQSLSALTTYIPKKVAMGNDECVA